jgi:hypothetical protein
METTLEPPPSQDGVERSSPVRTIARRAVWARGRSRLQHLLALLSSGSQVRVLPGGHMERRERPNIDTVRESLRDHDDRLQEEPPPAEEQQDDSNDAEREDEADS